ncbi:hypothetical protein FK268_11190 [Tsukamurella sputi]|uniref:Uncharacterized protein n=1 Tax=Tsukamurella sputi TaxID=2591848 RepID=A0A5C5RNC7_9ACTN|nr:hypothetical protein [Tsukamurella sputi]TWS24170.1 hypothetical protein FK268_11190 [Tsukamurella sputi]
MKDHGNRGILLQDFEAGVPPVMRHIADFSDAEYERYMGAYMELTRFAEDPMWLFVNDECLDLLDFIIGIAQYGMEKKHIPRTTERGTSIRIAAATKTMNAANSCFVYRDQRIAQAERLSEARGDDKATEQAVKKLLNDFYDQCEAYRWMIEARNALVHIDLMAIKMSVSLAVGREPVIVLDLDNDVVSQVRNLNPKKPNEKIAGYLEQLKGMPQDLSVFKLLNSIKDEMPEFNQKVLDALYPDEVMRPYGEIVCELVDRFEGKRGAYCFRTGPFSDRGPAPYSEMNPHVLAYAHYLVHGPEEDASAQS